MRTFLSVIALLFTFSAQAAPASRESIESLLTMTRTEAVMNSMYAGMEQMMRQGIEQNLHGESLTAEQRRSLDALPAKFVTLVREEMNWQKMKPRYVQIYQEAFDQEDVDGMLVFYASPAGQSVLNKMPVVVQKSLALSQALIQSMIPKMEQAMKDVLKEAGISSER